MLRSLIASCFPVRIYPRQMWLVLSVAACVLPATALVQAQENELIELLEQTNQEHRESLVSGIASGYFAVTKSELNREDRHFQLIFDRDKYRLEISSNSLAKVDTVDQARNSTLETHQVLLFEGERSLLVTYEQGQPKLGQLFNHNWTHLAISKTGFPAAHPVRLWEPSQQDLLGFDPTQQTFRFKSLNGDGRSAHASFDEIGLAEVYLFPPKPLRLVRWLVRWSEQVSVQLNLRWSESQGIAYVQRYVRTVQASDPSLATTSELVFDAFQANVSVDPQLLEVHGLNLPHDFLFIQNAPVPDRFYFDGQDLVRARRNP